MLLSLQEVGDRVEGAGLGTAYVRLDGLEALYGGEDPLVTALMNAVPLGPEAPRRRGGRQISHLGRRPHQPCPGNNLGPAGRSRFPRALPGGPAPGTRLGRDGDAPFWPAHPGRRGGHEAGDTQPTALDVRAAKAWELSMGWDDRLSLFP